MSRTIALAVGMLVAAAQADYHIRQVAVVEDGTDGFGDVVCMDADLDSNPEFTYTCGGPDRWLTWEQRPVNRYYLVKAETCVGDPYPPPGWNKGTFMPTDGGDIDSDGLPEILGVNSLWFYDSLGHADSAQEHLCLYECPVSGAHPDTLVWNYHYGTQVVVCPHAWLPGDLDRDGLEEIVFYSNRGYTLVFENRGDNQNELVWTSPHLHCGYDYAFGDFDQDSAMEFVFAEVGSDFVNVYECTGNDEYTWTDSIFHRYPNGADVFSGNDVDLDGKPEFFVVYMRAVPLQYFVYMYEATGDNSYEGVLVDSAGLTATAQGRNSVCSDIDGDGQEEMLVSFNDFVRVYKATGNNQFEWVYHWWNRGSGHHQSHVQSYDMNRNGYNDIVISGNSHTWILEMEAIKLLYPNGGQNLIPGVTYLIQWETYDPPSCDSVSLFLRRDTTWQLDTIATGLAPSDTGFPWVVPPGPVDSCWVVAIAYGPGWQYDESDAPLHIRPGGIAEAGSEKRVRGFRTPTVVGHVLWLPEDMTRLGHDPDSPDGIGSCPALLLDVAGRKVMELQRGENDIRYLAPGVYFVRTAESGTRSAVSVRKVVIQR